MTYMGDASDVSFSHEFWGGPLDGKVIAFRCGEPRPRKIRLEMEDHTFLTYQLAEMHTEDRGDVDLYALVDGG